LGLFFIGLYTYLYFIGILIGDVISSALKSYGFIIDTLSYFSGYDLYIFNFLAYVLLITPLLEKSY